MKNLFKSMVLTIFAALLSFTSQSQTALTQGDIAFIGHNLDGVDDYAFILLKDVDASTTINFTDQGWNDGAGFAANSGDSPIWTWSSGAALSCGTVVNIVTNNPGFSASVGTVSGAPPVHSGIGDQLFAYQGTPIEANIIAGLNSNETTGSSTDANWDGFCSSNSTSALPNSLTNGVNAIRLHASGVESDNWRYNCSVTSGSVATVRAAINNIANWVNNNGSAYVPANPGCTWNITCTAVCSTPPTAVCQNITIFLDGTGNATITPADLDGGSTIVCGPGTFSASKTSFNCGDVGANTVTLTVTDANSTTSSCFATVTVSDTISPIASCQDITIFLDGAGNANITAGDVNNGSTDNCGLGAISVTPSSFSCANVGPNSVTFTVTDLNGNTNTCTSTVTVSDTISPIASCQDITIFLDGAGNANITAGDVNNGSTDNCGLAAISVTPSSFNCANVGPNSVTFTVTDLNGNTNTCTSTVTVSDTISPTAVCQNITVFLDGAGTTSITAGDLDAGSSDNCGTVTLSASPTSFTCADVGANTTTLTVTDGSGNTSTCTATVTISDTVSPTITCPGNQTVTPTASCNYTLVNYTSLASATDNCGGSPTITQSPAPGTIVIGNTTITLTADDGNGNTSTCTFDVILVDATAPTAVCQNINVYLDGAGSASITAADLDGGSTDNCGSVTLSASQTAFTCADLGGTVAGDLIITAAYDVTLTGGTPKGVELYVMNDIANLSLYGIGSANNGGGSDGQEFTFPAVAVLAGTYIYVASESTQFTNWFGFAPDYTSGAMSINGDDAIELYGNGSVIDVFGDINLDGTGQPWDYLDGWAYRNNNSGPDGSTFTLSNWSFSGINALDSETSNATAATPIPVGTYSIAGGVPVTLTATDGSGNTSTCSAIVTVLDTVSPTAVCQAFTVNLDGAGNGSLVAADIDGGSSDNCGTVTLSASQTAFTCADIGPNNVTLTVNDGNGNTSTCTAVVTVVGSSATGTDVQTACGTFFWIDGNTYTASTNTPTFTIVGGAASGCDSVVTLDLTITVADQVLNVNSTNITATSAEITWDALTLPVTGSFAIEYREVGTTPWLSGTFATSVSTSAVINGLVAGTNYESRVTASCSTGQPGAPSASHSFSTNGGTCISPMILSQVSNSGNSVTLTWVPVPTVGWYEFRYKESSSSTWLSGGTISSAATSKSIFGLNPSTSYDFEGRRFCPAAGAWSNTLTLTTDPLTDCNLPPVVAASTVTGAGATITWPAVTGAGWYQFRYKENTSLVWISGGSAGGSATSKTYTGLNPGTLYDFEGRTYCANGTSSAWGATAFTTTALAGCELPPVLDPMPLASTSTSLTIGWTAATGAAWYTFQYKENGTSTWISGGSASGSATSKTYAGLTPSTLYDFQAKSYCPNGAPSAWSSTSTYALGVPAPVLLVDNTTNDKVTVLEDKALEATNHVTNIYPNPATDKVNVEIYMKAASDNSILRLLDMSGRLVREVSLQTVEGLNTLTMDVQGLSDGLYTMHVYQNGSLMYTAKVKKK